MPVGAPRKLVASYAVDGDNWLLQLAPKNMIGHIYAVHFPPLENMKVRCPDPLYRCT